MIGTLKCSYPGLSCDTMTDIMDQIQKSIRQKVSPAPLLCSIYNLTRPLQDDEMSWLDKSCLQLLVKRKDKPETLTFQVRNSQWLSSPSLRRRRRSWLVK